MPATPILRHRAVHLLTALCVTSGLLLLSACGGDSSQPAESGVPQGTNTAAVTPATTNATPPPPTKMELQELAARVAAEEEIRGLSPQRINASLDEAAAYLTRVTLPDGEFIYEYNPVTGESGSDYNMLRHAGSAYSMLQYYQHTNDQATLAKAKLAIEYLLTFVQTMQTREETIAAIVHRDSAKLGGNGLALIALAKYTEVTGDKQYVPVMQQLAAYIAATQDSIGNFTAHTVVWSTQQVTSFRSLYYPGEAILGLLRLNAIDGNERWLDVAEAGARWIIEIRDVQTPDEDLAHDHWMMVALDELYRQRPRETFINHSMRLARVVCAAQIATSSDPAYIGGWYYPPRVNPTSCRTEGLAASWRLARDFGKPELMPAIENAIRLGVTFQMRSQYVGPRLMDLHDANIARGGFPESFLNPNIRIDTVQHNISSFLVAIPVIEHAAARKPE
jgi:hypothetical protein